RDRRPAYLPGDKCRAERHPAGGAPLHAGGPRQGPQASSCAPLAPAGGICPATPTADVRYENERGAAGEDSLTGGAAEYGSADEDEKCPGGRIPPGRARLWQVLTGSAPHQLLDRLEEDGGIDGLGQIARAPGFAAGALIDLECTPGDRDDL